MHFTTSLVHNSSIPLVCDSFTQQLVRKNKKFFYSEKKGKHERGVELYADRRSLRRCISVCIICIYKLFANVQNSLQNFYRSCALLYPGC